MESTLMLTATVSSDKKISWLFSSDFIWAAQYSVHASGERDKSSLFHIFIKIEGFVILDFQ